MTLKTLGQLAILGIRIAGRVLIQGYKKALNNALNNPEAAAKPIANSSIKLASGKMNVDEAMKVLNLTPKSSRNEMVESFEHLFKVNDKEKGGSLYLQSKILRARESLDLIFSNKESKV